MAGKSNHFEVCGISSNLCHLFALCVNVIWTNSLKDILICDLK